MEEQTREETYVQVPVEEFVEHLRYVAYSQAGHNLSEEGKTVLEELSEWEETTPDLQTVYRFLIQDKDLEDRDIVFLHAYMFTRLLVLGDDLKEFMRAEYGYLPDTREKEE